MKARRLAWLLVLGSLGGCSCGDDDDDVGTGLAELSAIGAEGGTFELGGLHGVVPAGAVDEGDTVVVRGELAADVAGPPGAVGPVYELEADRPLREPITLELPYVAADLAGRSPLGLRVASSPDGIVWDCDPATAPRAQSSSVLAVVSHLSFWTLRYNPCEGAGDCTLPERCFDPGPTGYCAMPCTADADCPDPTLCFCGICSRDSCDAADDPCTGATTCSVEDGRGVCLPACTPLDRCGDPADQQLCSPGGRCAFQQSALCPDLYACADGEACLHQWCVPDDSGCVCGEGECACETPPDECAEIAREDCATPGDEDADGLADCADTDCAGSPLCTAACADPVPELCEGTESCGVDGTGNGVDDDCNGEVDEGCTCIPGKVRACSTAPPGRRDVGACEDGTMRCNGDGTWGTCGGGIGPTVEACNGADDDCDGCPDNGLACGEGVLACPEPGQLAEAAPFQDYELDGTLFFAGEADAWDWTVTGGPCDQLLLATSGQASYTMTAGSTPHPTFHPGLSGDYTVTMSVTPRGSDPVACTFVVHVRGPGMRVELCWDTTGADDLDLHLHRPDTTTDWFGTEFVANNDDCHWKNCKAGALAGEAADWGYPTSPLSACEGGPAGGEWQFEGACRNPRLDIDNVMTPGVPENINVDVPEDGKAYRVLVHEFSGGVTHPLVNVFCGGHLAATYGAEPDLVGGFTEGRGDLVGPMWRVVDVTPHVDDTGTTTGCDLEALHPPAQESGYWVTVDDISY